MLAVIYQSTIYYLELWVHKCNLDKTVTMTMNSGPRGYQTLDFLQAGTLTTRLAILF